MITHYQPSPLGTLKLTVTAQGLSELRFVTVEPEESPSSHPLLAACCTQLAEYFAGQRHQFNLPLDLQGTPFQKQVWAQLCTIPYGTTISYGTLSQALNNMGAIRAVGQANGRNPVAIIVPCHRVIGSNGKLTGYGGGLWRKKWLLTHEQPQQILF